LKSKVELLGVCFDPVTMDQAVDTALGYLTGARRPHLIVTANPEMLQTIGKDEDLRTILDSADMVVADGIGIVWASRRLGCPLPCRVTGIDLMDRMCERAAPLGKSVYLLGSKPGVAELAGVRLSGKYPGLKIAGAMHGYFGPDEDGKVISEIKSTTPDMLFAGMGIPRQEKWLFGHMDELDVPLLMGVGGSLDALSGATKRAPDWVQRANCEWLYRLVSEPRRLGRQTVLGAFALRVLREASTAKKKS